jgi:hypothetical protein
MGSPAIFAGLRTKLLTARGLLLQNKTVIDNDGDFNPIHNGHFEIEVAPWALSVFPEYTQGIIPLPLNQSHESNLLPSSSLAIWSYTHLGDPRILYGDSNISIRNEPQKDIPLKIGLGYKDVTWTWLAAITGDVIFIKSFAVEPSACYPDRGSVSEIYTDRHILELESLGPLTCLNSGECAELTEYWSLMSLPSEGCNHENTPSLLEKIADIANEHQQLSRGSTD